jgi:uncharacterized protein (TIGR02453 family)
MFNGFSSRTIKFLRELGANNDKAWFETHRRDYEEHLLAPLRALVEELRPAILAIDPDLDTAPLVGRTISRIYRDVRFSKDKSPFRTNMWLDFKRLRADWQDTPSYFLEFSVERYRYGMGFYRASRQTMDNLRRLLDTREKEFLEAVAFMKPLSAVLEGESYKRTLDPSKTGVILDWYQRKSCYVSCNKEIDEIFLSGKLADELAESFQAMKPLYDFLRRTNK